MIGSSPERVSLTKACNSRIVEQQQRAITTCRLICRSVERASSSILKLEKYFLKWKVERDMSCRPNEYAKALMHLMRRLLINSRRQAESSFLKINKKGLRKFSLKTCVWPYSRFYVSFATQRGRWNSRLDVAVPACAFQKLESCTRIQNQTVTTVYCRGRVYS